MIIGSIALPIHFAHIVVASNLHPPLLLRTDEDGTGIELGHATNLQAMRYHRRLRRFGTPSRSLPLVNSPTLPVTQSPNSSVPATQAVWPLPKPTQATTYLGVTHLFDASSSDGTTVDFFDFDFTVNPTLRLEMYDQDEDDAMPFDNRALYWESGVGQIARRLNAAGRGPVVAAWNGLFFDYEGLGPGGIASHLTPVVLDGQLHYDKLPNYRWTFGIKYENGKPRFQAIHMPSAQAMLRQFDYAAGAAQCVIREGVPLRLEHLQSSASVPIPTGAGAAEEAGVIKGVDQLKCARVSLGWSKESNHLYLLFVQQATLAIDKPISGGWTLADVQRFWMAQGAWAAINSDGGGPAQLAFLRNGGTYLLAPPNWASDAVRQIVSPNSLNAPGGGSLMYFYVRDGK